MAGSARITAAGVVGISGKPVRVFSYTMRSGAGGPGTITLYDGTSTAGTEKWKGTGQMDSGAFLNFTSVGKSFPNGCYCDMDADVSYIDFDYNQETA